MDEPYSDESPCLITERIDPAFGFAFNLENPSGIKILSRPAFDRLSFLQEGVSKIPDLRTLSCAEDDALYRHRLVMRRGIYLPPQLARSSSLSVWLHVLDGCNLGCFYCYIPELRKRLDADEIDPDLKIGASSSKQIADRLIDYCVKEEIDHLNIRFAGGEPTLALEEISQFCGYIEAVSGAVNVSFGMLSNGYFDHNSVLPILERYKISVSFSVDGMREGHNKIRFRSSEAGQVGTWDAILHNAQKLRHAGIRPFFLYTVTRKNIADIGAFASLAHAEGFGFRLSLERGKRKVDFSEQKTLRGISHCLL